MIGYYVIALPLGYVLAKILGVGLVGIWLGLAVGLVAIAATLLILLRRTVRRPLLTLQLDVHRASALPAEPQTSDAGPPDGALAV
jgi:MATE family multidrug resistance protein